MEGTSHPLAAPPENRRPSRTKLEVRPARPNDISKLSRFMVKAWQEAGPEALGFRGATSEAVLEITSERFLQRRLASPGTQLIVADDGSGFIGMASLRAVSPRETELTGMAVLKGFSDAGVETRLLNKATDAARRRGYRLLLAKTEMADERAVRFYVESGFTQSGKTTLKVGRTKLGFLLMEMKLSPGRRHR